jgi:hypothetical protein
MEQRCQTARQGDSQVLLLDLRTMPAKCGRVHRARKGEVERGGEWLTLAECAATARCNRDNGRNRVHDQTGDWFGCECEDGVVYTVSAGSVGGVG